MVNPLSGTLPISGKRFSGMDLHKKYGGSERVLFPIEGLETITFRPQRGVDYLYDYVKMTDDFATGKFTTNNFQSLLLSDLWFMAFFIVCNGAEKINDEKGWFVRSSAELSDLYETNTIDLWARGHGKSLLITITKTVMYHLKHPEHCTLILSFKRTAAESFQHAVMEVWKHPVLRSLFSGRLYQNPEKESRAWGSEKGACIRRPNMSRKENTVQASGLVEGMSTGGHFERLIFDDVVTFDTCTNIDGMNKCFDAFQMALNLGTQSDSDIVNIAGTHYHRLDPLVKIRDMKFADGEPMYKLRKKPATHDGTKTGKPVYVSDKKLRELLPRSDFNTQQLLDPLPETDRRFKGDMLIEVAYDEIPPDTMDFLLVDWAGDNDGSKKRSDDAWAFGVMGISPDFKDVRAAKIYIKELILAPMRELEAVNTIIDMYLGNVIEALCIEAVNSKILGVHVAGLLGDKYRIRVTEEDKKLVFLRPASRKKVKRISDALEWPLFNGKIHISNAVSPAYRARLRQELDMFPLWHDDGLDILSYIYDILDDVYWQTKIRSHAIRDNKRFKPKMKSKGGHLQVVNSNWMGA